MLNKATKIMSQRNDYKDELVNELNTLGFEVSTLDNLIPTNTVEETKEVTPIIINKGQIIKVEITDDELIEELQMQLDIAKEEIAYYHNVEKDYYNDIELFQEEISDLKDELEIKQGIIEHMKKVHKAEMEELKAQLTKDEPVLENIIKKHVKGGDAVKKCNKLDLLKKVKESEKRKEENMKKDLVKEALKAADEEAQRKAEEKEAAKAQMPKYTIAHDIVTFNKDIVSSTDFGVQGKIALETEEYAFEATNNHHMPIVYGCMSEETVRLVKQIITNEVDRFNFMNELESDAANFTHAQDEEFPLVVWRLTDDKGNVNYHAYTDKYVLIWNNNKFKVPARKMLKYALDKDPKHYRKLEQQKNTKKLSDKFIAICKELYAADFTPDNDPEPTKAVIKITKEENAPISYTDAPKITVEVDLDGSDDIDL